MADAGGLHTTQRLARLSMDKAGDLLPLCDFVSLLVAGGVSLTAAAADPPPPGIEISPLIWIAAAIAAFVLYDPRFAAEAIAGDRTSLLRGFLRRFLLFVGVLGVIAFAGHWLEAVSASALALWLGVALTLTGGSRLLLERILHRRTRAHGIVRAIPVAGVGDWLTVTLLADRPIRRWNAVLKASSDLVLGSVILVLLLPVLACIAVAIKLESPGPLLFKQRRHGFSSREFEIYKFRTMYHDTGTSNGNLQQTVRGDRRITRLGHFLRRFSLDELPQVFNVLEGTMSLVGPRPHAVNMRTEQRLGEEITDAYLHRHRVKPGITGWAQINGYRGATETVAQLRRRIKLDLYYVEHWSLGFDLKILSLTLRAVLRGANAY